MRRFSILTMVSVFAGVVMLASPPASAIPREHLNWGQKLSASDTSCPPGEPVINIVHKVVNDADSGTGGFWAFDEYVRKITVVEIGTDEYCATAKYEGSFETFGSNSPGCGDAGTCGTDDGTVAAGVLGTFQGGYSAIITGTLSPSFRTKGSIGKFDYDCDMSGTCTAFNWVDAYFDAGWGFIFDWWGWIYRGGNNGTWINQADGNSGDITGN